MSDSSNRNLETNSLNNPEVKPIPEQRNPLIEQSTSLGSNSKFFIIIT